MSYVTSPVRVTSVTKLSTSLVVSERSELLTTGFSSPLTGSGTLELSGT